MMVRHFFVLSSLGLVACGSRPNPAEQELLAHTWAPTEQACGSDFLRFTPAAFEVHHAGAPVTAIQVLKITTAEGFPNQVMVVVGPNEPGSSKPVAEEEKIGFVLDLSDNRMRLVGAGAPSQLKPVSPQNPNLERFNRVSCP